MATLIIKLWIKGDAQHALEVINNMLDNGDPQDQINDHSCEDGCDRVNPERLKVLTASVEIAS